MENTKKYYTTNQMPANADFIQDMLFTLSRDMQDLVGRISLGSLEEIDKSDKDLIDLAINSRIALVIEEMKLFAICGSDIDLQNAINTIMSLSDMKRSF